MNGTNDGYKTVSMRDIDTDADMEMIVADTVSYGGATYLLVYGSEYIDENEAEAYILKEIKESDDEYFYVRVTDGSEFETVAGLFDAADGEYSVEM